MKIKRQVLLFCSQSLKVKHSDDLKSQHRVNNEKHLDPRRLQMDCLQLLVLKNSSTKTPSRTPLTCTSDHSACFFLYLLLVCKLSRRTLLNPPNTGAHLNHQVGVNRDTTHSKPSIGFNTFSRKETDFFVPYSKGFMFCISQLFSVFWQSSVA